MRHALAILLLATALACHGWRELCARALGGLIQVLCDLGFTP